MVVGAALRLLQPSEVALVVVEEEEERLASLLWQPRQEEVAQKACLHLLAWEEEVAELLAQRASPELKELA